MDSLPISVIVITRNAEETLEECLASIQKNRPAEIIVVDGNSTDRTLEIARKFTERIYSDGGKGMGYASQLGVEQATQEYIALVDADVFLTDGALETMFVDFKDTQYVSISATVLPGAKYLNYWNQMSWQHFQYSAKRRQNRYLATMACLLRTATIKKYGFETSKKYLHDVDLEMRLQQAGQTFYISKALVYHNHKMDFRNFVRYRYFLGQVSIDYMRKWGPWHIRFWAPPITLYWISFCIIRLKPTLIPYFIVDGVVRTAGMAKGFFGLIRGSEK